MFTRVIEGRCRCLSERNSARPTFQSFPIGPAVVLTAAAAGRLLIQFLKCLVSYIANPQIACHTVKAEAPGITQAI